MKKKLRTTAGWGFGRNWIYESLMMEGWGFGRNYIYELLMVVIIIFSLLYIAVPQYRAHIRHAKVAAAVSETISRYRNAMSVYYALYGEWPKDMQSVQDLLPPLSEREWSGNRNVAADRIIDGAIDIQVNLYSEEGKPSILTIRPATPKGELFGPVRFVVGPWKKLDAWTAAGVDHTTIHEQDGHKEWK